MYFATGTQLINVASEFQPVDGAVISHMCMLCPEKFYCSRNYFYWFVMQIGFMSELIMKTA